MILCSLGQLPAGLDVFHASPWRDAIDWIERVSPTTPEGVFELRGDQMYVNVHSYETLPRDQCTFESHRRFIDLQYCIEGGELIEYLPPQLLEIRGDYDSERDLICYALPKEGLASRIMMRPGMFAIFFPEDAHMPKITDAENRSVKKLVVKIDVELLR